MARAPVPDYSGVLGVLGPGLTRFGGPRDFWSVKNLRRQKNQGNFVSPQTGLHTNGRNYWKLRIIKSKEDDIKVGSEKFYPYFSRKFYARYHN